MQSKLYLSSMHGSKPTTPKNLSHVSLVFFTMETFKDYIKLYSGTSLRNDGPWDHENYLVISGFSLYQGKKNKEI